jgi:hypothetical protein
VQLHAVSFVMPALLALQLLLIVQLLLVLVPPLVQVVLLLVLTHLSDHCRNFRWKLGTSSSSTLPSSGTDFFQAPGILSRSYLGFLHA